ncbi:MAG: TonB-dependent receptor plug domain-containing protein, partial [Pseudomonadota bacterium]|nr:TonB-dependent receptor plug domain-containing protein [Pseudomonadota bacterium]
MTKCFLLFAVLAAASSCAQAQISGGQDDAAQSSADHNITDQPVIVVTATRQAQTVDASLADVSVITRADIDASGAPDLSDLLRAQAGIDLARSGGAGEQTALFLRGTNSNHVLVLVDGVRIASTGTGGVDFSLLPLDAIERIEIVRGPRAAYWGSDAIGGVIQIFTRRLNGPRAA